MLAVESEISLHEFSKPNLCFHREDKAYCHDFEYSSFFQIKSGLETTLRNGSRDETYQDCCTFAINAYSTEATFFSNLTCNPATNCHVICGVEEVTKNGRILELPVCSNVTFWLYFILRAIADLFPAVLISLFDAVVLTMVEQHGGDYGRQKMFGLFAIGTSAPIVGYFIDKRVGVHGNYDYAPVFYTFDVLLLLTAIITLLLPIKVEVQRTSMLKNLSKLIRTSEFNLLVVIVIVLGSLCGYLETFLYIYLSKDLGASNLLLGLTITVGIVPSLPFLYRSDSIVNYCGHHYLLMLAFIGYCIRFAGLSYLSNPFWVIPLEMLELFTINLMQVATATLAYKLAPKTLVATAQGLVWISHFDIGRALGTIVGGYLIKVYGMIRVFEGASVLSAICATVYLTLHQVFKYAKANRNTDQSAQQRKENGAITNGNYMPLPVIDNKRC
ncbi:Major facilitator superfamily domain-containing protein 6 [Armadillidium nasatum]|uniref:Major facilitator superfamily domain-containing protein 6 n=1 Tax=Armadillidium nasatum TaxID=96803 RepID=A0A5N5TDV6_9CRUS|nr:Major facilitator superfamily domain-containing protein 6 [Armadillidium nasatum]